MSTVSANDALTTILPAPEEGYTGYVDDEPHHDQGGDTLFGFWVYILSDCILFATLFAVFAVLRGNFVDSTEAVELFDLSYVLAETALLLFSSFTLIEINSGTPLIKGSF